MPNEMTMLGPPGGSVLDEAITPTIAPMPRYLTTPNPTFFAGGGWHPATGAGPEDAWMAETGDTPGWAIERYGSEQAVWEHFRAFDHPDDILAAWEMEAQQAANAATTQQATETTLGGLGDISGDYRKFLSGAQQDPYRLAALKELQRRASPGYSAVTPQQRTAMELEMARSLSRARNRMQSNLGAAGWGESGGTIGLDPLFTSIGAGATTQLSGQIAMENERVRGQAARDLGSTAINWQNFEAGITDDIANIDRQIALLEGDPLLMESDAWQAPSMNFGREQYADMMENLDRYMTTYEESLQPDIWDALGGLAGWASPDVFGDLL